MSPAKQILASFSASAALIAGAAAAAQDPSEGGRRLVATLTGSAEVPGPGDPDGSGTAVLTVNPGQERVCYKLEVTEIGTATAAHIHAGATGTAGDPVVTLEAPGEDGDSDDCTEVDRALAIAIIRNPASYYVNVHNADYPAGAIRGQLSK